MKYITVLLLLLSMPVRADIIAAAPLGPDSVTLDCQDTSSEVINSGLIQIFTPPGQLAGQFSGWASEIAFCGDTTRLQTKLNGDYSNTHRWNYDEDTRAFSLARYIDDVEVGPYVFYCVIPQNQGVMVRTVMKITPYTMVYATIGTSIGGGLAVYNEECAVIKIISRNSGNNVSPVE